MKLINITWRWLKQYSVEEGGGHVQERSSWDKPSQDDVKHIRLRDLVGGIAFEGHGEQSDQSDQQDQLLFSSIEQLKQERFWIGLPMHSSFKQRRERVWLEPTIPQEGLQSIERETNEVFHHISMKIITCPIRPWCPLVEWF